MGHPVFPCMFWAKCFLFYGIKPEQRDATLTVISTSSLTRKKKDVRQAQQQRGGSGGQGESQEQQEPIETIIQLVMTQQMIEAQKVRKGLLLTYTQGGSFGHGPGLG